MGAVVADDYGNTTDKVDCQTSNAQRARVCRIVIHLPSNIHCVLSNNDLCCAPLFLHVADLLVDRPKRGLRHRHIPSGRRATKRGRRRNGAGSGSGDSTGSLQSSRKLSIPCADGRCGVVGAGGLMAGTSTFARRLLKPISRRNSASRAASGA